MKGRISVMPFFWLNFEPMRKIILYIAQSLDGKIARLNGDVDWLERFPNPEDEDYGYASFYDSVDVTLMGNRTYEKILSFGLEFPYVDKENYVFTQQKGKQDTKFVKFVGNDLVAFVREMKRETGKNIWLVGGSEINTILFNEGLIDEIYLFTMPVTVGEGIPLFTDRLVERKLNLAEVSSYSSGVILKKYRLIAD